MTRAITRSGALRRRAPRMLFHFNKRGTLQIWRGDWGARDSELNSARTFARSNAMFAPAETRSFQIADRESFRVSHTQLSSSRRGTIRLRRQRMHAGTRCEKVGDKKKEKCVAGNCAARRMRRRRKTNGEGKGCYKSALARLLESSECV